MFLSNPAKSFLALTLILLATAGCGWLKTAENTSVPSVAEPKSRYPFKTREPENFQCEIVETAGQSVRRTRLAGKGSWRRIDYDFGAGNQRTVLRIDKEYLIDFERKVFAEKPGVSGSTGEQAFSELTHELLTVGERAEFEETGREGSVLKYRIVNEASETAVYYDESIGLPVKQEFFSTTGGERSLEFSVEMVDFKLEPDADLFTLPAGFAKVSMEEFHRQR